MMIVPPTKLIAEAQGGHQHRNTEAKWDQDLPQNR